MLYMFIHSGIAGTGQVLTTLGAWAIALDAEVALKVTKDGLALTGP